MRRGFGEFREIKEDREIKSDNTVSNTLPKFNSNITFDEAKDFWDKVFESEESIQEFLKNI